MAAFELDGQELVAPHGGPQFTLPEAIAFVVNCETKAEADEYRERMSAGGESRVCGWGKDRYGASWQIVPRALTTKSVKGSAGRSARVTQALMKMERLNFDKLEQAFNGASIERAEAIRAPARVDASRSIAV